MTEAKNTLLLRAHKKRSWVWVIPFSRCGYGNNGAMKSIIDTRIREKKRGEEYIYKYI